MTATFFLSHSSNDKPIVEQIANGLGPDRCWLDLAEITPGSNVLARIDRGIVDSRVFVLFWSLSSADSPWVNEEISQARVRAIRDSGYRIVVVRLDDAMLPDSLSFRSWITFESVERTVDQLNRVFLDLTPSEQVVGTPETRDIFQDREQDLDRLEEYANSVNGGVLITGLRGMGKTSFIRKALAQLFPHLSAYWIDGTSAASAVRLIAAISRPLGRTINPESIAGAAVEIWKNDLLPDLVQSERSLLVLDDVPSREEQSREASDLLHAIVSDLGDQTVYGNPRLIMSSGLGRPIGPEGYARLSPLALNALSGRDVTRALRMRMAPLQVMSGLSTSDIDNVARHIRGYPLAIGLATSVVAEKGTAAFSEDAEPVRTAVAELARDLLSELSIGDDERQLLTYLAASRTPLRERHLAILSESGREALRTLRAKNIVDSSAGSNVVHSIVREYALESLATPSEIVNAHSTLSKVFRSEWVASMEGSAAAAENASIAYFHAIAAGETEIAQQITYAFSEEAADAGVELYRRGKYDESARVLKGLMEVGADINQRQEFYYALALGRIGHNDEAVERLNDLIARSPGNDIYYHAKGSILRRSGDANGALESFREAVVASERRNVVALTGYAGQLADLDHLDDAYAVAQEAVERSPDDSQALVTLVHVLELMERYAEALGILSSALSRRPDDTRLHARAGILAKQLDDLTSARDHLERAAEDASLGYTLPALADVYLMLGDSQRAKEVLERAPRTDRGSNATYLSTMSNILSREGDLDAALEQVKEAQALEPNNAVHHGGRAQIHLEMARRCWAAGDTEGMNLNLTSAAYYVASGLSITPGNPVLLSIEAEINRMRDQGG